MASTVELMLLAAAGPLLREGASGLWALDWSQSDVSSYPNANDGTQALTKAWTITAGDAAAGTTYIVEVPFNGETATGTVETLGLKPYLNGSVVTTSGGDVIGGTFYSASTGFAGDVRLLLRVTATGASGTANLFIQGSQGANANRQAGSGSNSSPLSSQATAVAFNSTIANTIAVASVWGASSAGQTITGSGSTFTRKGP